MFKMLVHHLMRNVIFGANSEPMYQILLLAPNTQFALVNLGIALHLAHDLRTRFDTKMLPLSAVASYFFSCFGGALMTALLCSFSLDIVTLRNTFGLYFFLAVAMFYTPNNAFHSLVGLFQLKTVCLATGLATVMACNVVHGVSILQKMVLTTQPEVIVSAVKVLLMGSGATILMVALSFLAATWTKVPAILNDPSMPIKLSVFNALAYRLMTQKPIVEALSLTQDAIKFDLVLINIVFLLWITFGCSKCLTTMAKAAAKENKHTVKSGRKTRSVKRYESESELETEATETDKSDAEVVIVKKKATRGRGRKSAPRAASASKSPSTSPVKSESGSPAKSKSKSPVKAKKTRKPRSESTVSTRRSTRSSRK